MFNQSNLIFIALTICTVGLSGCASQDKESLLPQDGPTMVQVYRAHLEGVGKTKTNKTSNPLGTPIDEPVLTGDAVQTLLRQQANDHAKATRATLQAIEYTRTSENEVNQLFPRLDNPDIYMYVFPHLSTGEQLPVPGYTTIFPLYENVKYALPGEASNYIVTDANKKNDPSYIEDIPSDGTMPVNLIVPAKR